MKINRVSVSLGETFAKKCTKYETWRTDVSYEVELSPNDDEKDIKNKLYQKCRDDLKIMKHRLFEEEQR